MEKNAILDRRLAVAQPPEGVIVKGGESSEYRLQIIRQHGGCGDTGGQDESGLVLQPALMLLSTPLQLAVDLGGKVKGYQCAGHESFPVTPSHSTIRACRP